MGVCDLSGIVDGDNALNDGRFCSYVNVLHDKIFDAMKYLGPKSVICQARSRARYEKLAVFNHLSAEVLSDRR